MSGQRFDRTEVDMRLGRLLVESKLTESDFQTAPASLVEDYRDVEEVFDMASLPRLDGRYVSYQLIRNVLAAYSGLRPGRGSGMEASTRESQLKSALSIS